MASTITLLPRSDSGDPDTAERIIEAFAEETGLDSTATDDGGRVFDVHDHHEIEVVHTLDEIDPAWPEHVALADPA